jgi:magnesium-transporting ATPase (P-type)
VSQESAAAWHALSVAEALSRLAATTEGLDSAEAGRRLVRYGPNRLRVAAPVSVWTLLLRQLRSVVVALVAEAKAGVVHRELADEWPEVGELPFTSERRLMATFHRVSEERLLACLKGGPGRLAALCTRLLTAVGERPMDETARQGVLEANRGLAARGLRVLALADAELPDGRLPHDGVDDEHLKAVLKDAVFLGLVGVADPPAADVKKTIELLAKAGIRTVMVTGDQRITAEAVPADLGQLMVVYLPALTATFHTTPLGADDWLLVLGLSVVPLLVGQVVRAMTPTARVGMPAGNPQPT